MYHTHDTALSYHTNVKSDVPLIPVLQMSNGIATYKRTGCKLDTCLTYINEQLTVQTSIPGKKYRKSKRRWVGN